MPKRTAQHMIEWRIKEFNGLPKEKRLRRSKLLRDLLKMGPVRLVVIPEHFCCVPTRKRLQKAGAALSHMPYVEVFTVTKEKKGFVAVDRLLDGGAVEIERVPLESISLSAKPICVVGEETDDEHFLLLMAVSAS